MRRHMRACLISCELQLKMRAMDGFFLFNALLQPLMIAFIALFTLQSQAASELAYVVVGSGMAGVWSVLLWSGILGLQDERWTGTLEILVASPTPIQVVVAGKILGSVTVSLLSMIGSYAMAALVFRTTISVAHPLEFMLSIPICLIALSAVGLLVAPLTVLRPDLGSWGNGMEYPIYILGGFLFPISLVPDWTRPVSYLLPPFWAARALHASSSGSATYQVDLVASWAIMGLLSLMYVALSVWLFGVVLRRARVSATLGMQ